MAKRAPADPDKFQEASDWFRGRVAVTRAEWDAMSFAARRQAFTIAGTQQLRVVQAVLESIQLALDKGLPIGTWRKDIKKRLGSFATENSANLTTAFINAHQIAYNTGRWYQMSEPSVTRAMPYRRWDTVMDGRQTPVCDACNNTVLPHDHPWWLTHWPPAHPRCRSAVRAITASMAKRRGITEKPPRPDIGNEWGLSPVLRAGSVWEPKREDFDPSAWVIYQRNQERMRLKRSKPANDNSGE